MTNHIRIIATIVALLIGAGQPGLCAQRDSSELTPDRQQALLTLFSRVCEAGEDTRLQETFAGFAGAGAEEIALETLTRGAPDQQRKATREAAKRRYALRATLLASDNDKLFDKRTTERLRATSEQAYVASAEEVLDLIYRENALRALGVFGNAESIPAIEAAVEARPALTLLASDTVEAIRAR